MHAVGCLCIGRLHRQLAAERLRLQRHAVHTDEKVNHHLPAPGDKPNELLDQPTVLWLPWPGSWDAAQEFASFPCLWT